MLEEALADAMQRILVLPLVEYNLLNSIYCGGIICRRSDSGHGRSMDPEQPEPKRSRRDIHA